MIDDDIEKKLEKKNIYLENCVWFVIEDDAMAPQLEKGTKVLIDTSKREIASGQRYALRFDGTTVVRRLIKKPGGDTLVCCDNPNVQLAKPPFEINDELYIFGMIVAWMSFA